MQIFRPAANTFAKLSILIGGLVALIVLMFLFVGPRSPYLRAPIGIAVAQPVRFSHELHSGQLNINCRYCHTSVEYASYAGLPDTHTCMSCHSQIATYSQLLAPVRASYTADQPLIWNPVHNLADHIYFNHGVHLSSGVGCEECHGQVTEMPLVWRDQSMTMSWCLECHMEPEEFLRPVSEVYNFDYEAPANQIEVGLELVDEYHIDIESGQLTDCYVCHN